MESRNAVRTERTRTALIEAARARFASEGYATTSTPSIAEDAQVSRGALYHHFRDKADLFQAVVEREYALVASAIATAAMGLLTQSADSLEAIVAGGDAFLDAMRDEGRRRILLIDAPAVLGPEAIHQVNARHTGRTLREGIAAGVACGDFADVPIDATADLLDAVYDRVALVEGDDRPHRLVLRRLMEGLRQSE